jgi:hypothetical protein
MNCDLCQGSCVLCPLPFKTQLKETLVLAVWMVVYVIGMMHFIAANW